MVVGGYSMVVPVHGDSHYFLFASPLWLTTSLRFQYSSILPGSGGLRPADRPYRQDPFRPYLFENVIADAVGGALLAFILTAVLIVGNLCLVHLPGRQVWRRLVAGFVTIIAGGSLNSAIFYAAEFFYSPVPVKLDVVLDYPVGGNIVSDPDAAKDRKNSE